MSASGSKTLVELMDLNPAICELTGIPPLPHLNAKSLLPLLHGKDTICGSHVVTALERFQAIRTRNHKFINNINDILELYDLNSDPEERNNVASKKPELCAAPGRELTEALSQGGITRR